MGCANGLETFFGDQQVDAIMLRSDQLRIPLNAMIELTYKCNVDCVHCYCQHLNEPKTRPELTTDEWKSALDQLADLGTLYLSMTGGEILVRKDFWEIARHAKKNQFALCLYSNGTLIDEKNADRLAELGPYVVEISLLHPDAEKHDLLAQRRGSYDRIMRAVPLLRERNINVVLKTTVLRENIGKVKELKKIASDLGAVGFEFGTDMSSKNDGDRSPFQHEPTKEQMFDYLVGSDPIEWNVVDKLPQERAKAKGTCGAAQNGIAINPYGDILPCIQLFIALGNIKEVTLREAWDNPPQVISHIRNTKTYGQLPECAGCSLIQMCKRCHGHAYLETGRWDAKYEQGCETAKLNNEVNEYLKRGKTDHPYRNTEEGKLTVTEAKKNFQEADSSCCGGGCQTKVSH